MGEPSGVAEEVSLGVGNMVDFRVELDILEEF